MSAEKSTGVNLLPFKIYGVIYVVLMICYITGSIGRGEIIPTNDWINKAFPKGGESLVELQKEAIRNIAEFRADMDYAFDTVNNVPVQLSAGQKATMPIAAEIVLAVRSDAGKSAKEMSFPYAEMKIYKEGWFWNINWAYTFTVYNLLGLFVGLYFGLKAPVGKMLSDSAKETAEALASARAAEKEAGQLKQKYEELLKELDIEKAKLNETLQHEEEVEKIRQHELAEQEAKAILKSVKSSINADIEIAARRLKREIATHATIEARKLLEQELSEETHKQAVDDFIKDLES